MTDLPNGQNPDEFKNIVASLFFLWLSTVQSRTEIIVGLSR